MNVLIDDEMWKQLNWMSSEIEKKYGIPFLKYQGSEKYYDRGTAISKTSQPNEIQIYFQRISELFDAGEQFPVDLDTVWMVVYGQKSDAVAALKENFLQDVDYQVLRQNPQNPQGGRPIEKYFLSVSCLEYFIARKVRAVFDIYRIVFHTVRQQFAIPQTFSQALMLAAQQQEQIEQQAKALEEAKPKIDYSDYATGNNNLHINLNIKNG